MTSIATRRVFLAAGLSFGAAPAVGQAPAPDTPLATIMKRLRARSPGSYGGVAEERQKVETLISTIEPLLRRSADCEIDTGRPVQATADEILRLVQRS